MRKIFATLLLITQLTQAQNLPNIVVILADDMGYGEVQALNPKYSQIKTPNLDKVTREGIVFTDGHSGSSVCTPTRYGLITGRYAWRTRLQSNVLKGGESLVSENTLTVADLLKENDYHTVMIGKWHLGMMFDGVENHAKGAVKPGAIVSEGPIDKAGFDEFHGFHYARQMDLWIDNNKVTKNIEAVDMLPELTKSAVNYINKRKGNKQPFFMYIPWNAPHAPVTPSKEWEGKSGINAHADFVMQTDDSYGKVIQALKNNGLWENTLVIYSADNGTSEKTSKQKELNNVGHQSSAQFNGFKSDIYDGGHRVPFMVTWPKVIKPGSTSKELVCLTDILATLADITNRELKDDEGVDSHSFLPLLKGNKGTPRESVIHHSIRGYFAIRKDNWKLCLGNGSGGWSDPADDFTIFKNAKKLSDKYQLFDMSVDEEEKNNVADTHPELIKEMVELLKKQVYNGRSTPGKTQKNDIENIILEKGSIVRQAKKKKVKKH